MLNYLAVSVITNDQPGLVEKISSLASKHDCNVEDSRMMIVGVEFAALMLISGNWGQIAKTEKALDKLSAQPNYLIQYKRTEEYQPSNNELPYSIQAVLLDGPGLIRQISDFFAKRKINIGNLQTDSYKAPHTGAPMLEVELEVNIPSTVQISEIRESFAELCDELNIDASFEAIKP